MRTYSLAINWRPKGIFYAKNEIFVDIIENVEFIYDLKTNTVKRNEIYGSCMVKSYLSGIPVCRMGFNENYMSSIENNDVSKNTDTEPLPENQMRIENIEEGESLLEGGEEDHEEKESKTLVAPSLDDLGGDAHLNHEEESEKSLENKVPKTTAKSFKHRIPIRNIQFHQCIELSKIYRDNIVTFIPPDDKFELMSYQVEQHKNKKKLPLISIKPVFKVIQKTKRLLVMCTLNTTFPRRRHCKSLLVRKPTPI